MKLTPDQTYHLSIAFFAHLLFLVSIGLSIRVPNFTNPLRQQETEIINIGTNKEIPPALPNKSTNDIISDSQIDTPVESPPIDNEEFVPTIPLPQSDLVLPEEESELPPKDLTKEGRPLPGEDAQAPRPHGNIPRGGFSKGEVGPPEPKEPSFYGDPIHGKCLFVLDNSGSMIEIMRDGSKRIDSLRAEVLGAIKGFTETDEFDCILFYNSIVIQTWGELRPATEANKQEAIDWINKFTAAPKGDTPTLQALEAACALYPKDLEQFLFVSDGVPSNDTDMTTIIFNFPYLWSFEKCNFLVICIGKDGLTFMQRLAKTVEGKCVTVE